MESLPVVKWLHKELSSLLECDISEEYAKNILNIESESELKEFIGSLLDLDIEKNKLFLNQLLLKLKKPSNHPDMTVYIKPELEEPKSKYNKKATQKFNDQENTIQSNQLKQTSSKKGFSLTDHSSSNSSSKASNRRVCECQATKHKLIGNCLKCGRIVCEQEGSGPCYFCSNLICTREEYEKINRGSNKGEKLKADLLSRTWHNQINELNSIQLNQLSLNEDENLKKAIEHKNKLIDFDRTSAKRTQVIDDESDYFNTNSKWLSQKQRDLLQNKQQELRDKRFGNRISNKTFTLDFAGRKILDEQQNLNYATYASEIENILTDKSNQYQQSDTLINRDIESIKLKYIEEKPKKETKKESIEKSSKNNSNYRLQDQELQEMKDDGMCLSMHQPWASLLVAGIKQHEGRSWYTPYRGRLWIHAGSKQPTELDIKEVETFYKCYYSNHKIEFPTNYPTSCLIGYVDLVDCLSSDAYKQKFPNGESESEFVFICKNPKELLIKLQMSGQHKIFKLEKTVHMLVKKTPVIDSNWLEAD